MVTPFTAYPFSPTGAPAGFAIAMPDRITRSEFNAKDFGAVGDGITDDTDAIQLTFDAAFGSYVNPIGHAPATYRSVYIPAGEYKIMRMLTLRGLAAGYIHGAGRDSTRLVYKGPIAASDGETRFSPRTILLRTNGLAYALFEDMSFEMTGAGLTTRPPEAFANRRTDATVCFDWNWDDSDPTNTTCDIWMNCKFKGATYGMTVGIEYYEVPLGTSISTVTIGPVATCTTSLTMIQSANFNITTQAGKSAFFPVNAIIEVSMRDPGGAAPIIRGKVVSYNNTNGALVLDLLTVPPGAMTYYSGEVFPTVPGTPWQIWECRKTFITQPGLEANFTVAGHITPMVSPLNDTHINSFDRPRVASYNNVTGQLVINTSSFDSNGTYYSAAGVPTNYTSVSPPSVTASSWSFRHWWGYECDASSWINCVFEDCYQGIVHGNFNVINSQFIGGRFSRCAANGWFGSGGICQSLIGITFEDNGGKGLIGTLGDDGGDPNWQNYCDARFDQPAGMAMVGCQSNSLHFVGCVAGMNLIGCRHMGPVGVVHPSLFLRHGSGQGNSIEGCYSLNGVLTGWGGDAHLTISDSTFVYNWTESGAFIHEFITQNPLTFSQLPNSTWLSQGLVVSINDATVNGWSNPVTGGSGALSVSMQWNGTAWTVIGK